MASRMKKKPRRSKQIVEFVKKDSRMQEKYAKLQSELYYIQGWFIRTSWKNKAKFVTKFIRSLRDIDTLRSITNALTSVSKDTYYAKSQTTKFSYDIVPIDDDRCLDEPTLSRNMNSDLKWLEQLHEENDKVNILLYLIKIGGRGLAQIALKEANTLCNILEFESFLQITFKKKEKINLKHTQKLAELINKEVAKNANILPLVDEYKTYLELVPNKSSKIPEATKRKRRTEKYPKNIEKLPKQYNTSLRRIRDVQRQWQIQLKKLIRSARTGLPERVKLLFRPTVDIDSLQTFPLWVNRRIVTFLNEEDKMKLSKVNRYWKYTIDEVTREKNVRKNLNEILRKMETKLLNMKLPGQLFVARSKKRNPGRAKSADGNAKNKKTVRNRARSADLEGMFGTKSDFKESIYTLVKRIPSKYIPFNGLYNDTVLHTVYMYDRSIDCNRKWIVASENTFIVLYNMITGSKSKFVFSGHSLVITCVAFFPKTFRIASGSLDKTVKTWDLWNKKVIETFHGHRDVIISLSVNEEYVASCGRDNAIRIFKQMSGGICVLLLDDSYWTPTVVVLSLENIVYWATREGAIKMFSITDKSIKKTIDIAHKTDIIFLGKFDTLIVTVGNDNYVRIWNPTFSSEHCIIEFFHEKAVYSAIITYLTLITCCEDGALRFWHIGTGKMFRTIQINFAETPMISLKCQEYYNHIKIICNNEANIYILEFPLKWAKPTKNTNPYQNIYLHPLNERLRSTKRERRMNKLTASKCTLPQFRKRESYKDYKIVTEALLRTGIREPRLIYCYPRYYKSSDESDI